MKAENDLSQINRDSLIEEIKKDIDNVIEEINSYEKIRLLGAIGSTIDGGIKFLRPALPNVLETSVEYALSIATCFENHYDAPIPSAEDMINIFGKLEKIREKYLNYILTENNLNQYSYLEQSLRSRVIENTLTVRGEGYRVHIDEVFLELFDQHKHIFLKHYGFDPDSILSVIEYLEEELEHNKNLRDQEYKEFIKWMKGQDMRRLVMKYNYLPQDPFMFSQIYQLETLRIPRFKSVDDAFKFNIDDLTESEREVIKELSTKFAENINFLNLKFNALPLNDTVITSKPILFSPERNSYYLFSTRILHRNIFNIGEYLLKNADNIYFQDVYLSKNKKGRSTYFEEKVMSLISNIIPKYKVYGNLKYRIEHTEYEIDTLLDLLRCKYFCNFAHYENIN